MGIPAGLTLIAVGAILAFAVTSHPSGINLYAVGWILIGAGVLGIVLSFILWDSWAGGGFWGRRQAPPPRRGRYERPPPL